MDTGKGMHKTKVVIAGIGGVGGYFGGKLAYTYKDSKDIEVLFLCRNEHLRKIKDEGLKVIQGETEFIARPALATNNSLEIGPADYVIIATKSYDLDAVMEQLQPVIHKGTILLPLLNGVDNSARVRKRFPENVVLDGCVYIVARLEKPGVIINKGTIQTLYFGIEGLQDERCMSLLHLLKHAGIEATLSPGILSVIWEKFIFLSPLASLTSYYNLRIGEIRQDHEKMNILMQLINEVTSLARVKNVNIPDSITRITWDKIKALPPETQTSMHLDFESKKPHTELETLTGYVVNEANAMGIDAPGYMEIYRVLKRNPVYSK